MVEAYRRNVKNQLRQKQYRPINIGCCTTVVPRYNGNGYKEPTVYHYNVKAISARTD